LIISDSSTTLLSLMITESIGTVRAYETEIQLGKQFRRRFPKRTKPSQQGPCARTKPSFSWGSSFADDFQGGKEYVFGDDYRVNRDYRVNKECARIRNKASTSEAVSSKISKAAATSFSVTITESPGIVRTDKSRHQLGKKFR